MPTRQAGSACLSVTGLCNLQLAVGDERAQCANRGGNRSDDGADDSGRQRELSNRPSLLLDHHSTNVSFFDELSKLREDLFGRSFELLPERTFHGRPSSTQLWRVLNRRSTEGLVPTRRRTHRSGL